MKRIVFTGGGTGGHILPNLAIIQKIKEDFPNIEILYIGSKKGPEAEVIPAEGIKFKAVATGKLRRYFSLLNFVDIFRIPFGAIQAYFILRKFKPHVIFSKGGFVSIPVMYAAHYLKIPIVLHESDASPGLANRLGAKKASVICLAYPDSNKYFHTAVKMIYTGNPVREMIFEGSAEKGYKITGFKKDLPVILVVGGSQGAQHINEVVFNAAKELCKTYQIVHICGKGKLPKNKPAEVNYKAFEYLDKELSDIYAISNMVVSRAGANSIAEIEALELPAVLIPLGGSASRGEQSLNAKAFNNLHPKTSRILSDDDLTKETLNAAINEIFGNQSYKSKASSIINKGGATKRITEVLLKFLV